MAVKRGTAIKSKSSFAFIWYLLAWFTFRTLPILYFKVTRNAEAVDQKKWGSHFVWAGVSITRSDKSPLTHSVSFANKQDYSAEVQLDDSLSQIPQTGGMCKSVKTCILDAINYIGTSTRRGRQLFPNMQLRTLQQISYYWLASWSL
jgi:hypothetical protein